MGDSHFRSNILEQGDEALKIKITNASFTALTTTALTGNALTASALTTSALTANALTVTASSGFKIPIAAAVASANLLASASATKMLRIDIGATPYYCKLFQKA